jgi:Transglycosylase SLT domain
MTGMKLAPGFVGLLLMGPWCAGAAMADTLFLRVGSTLKIESLSCDAARCVATVKGGGIELRAVDVLRVEPDEDVDPEAARPEASQGTAGSRPRPETQDVERLIAESARRYALPRSLVRAVARAESSLRPEAVSPKGALGVMQLMPGTAKELGVSNAFDPAENIDAGARLLRQLLEKYEGRVAEALAAYNAGPAAVARAGGVPRYRETRGYIRRVVRDFENAEKKGETRSPRPEP